MLTRRSLPRHKHLCLAPLHLQAVKGVNSLCGLGSGAGNDLIAVSVPFIKSEAVVHFVPRKQT